MTDDSDASSQRNEVVAAGATPERPPAGASAHPGFLARVSHEFRTPLNGILGLTELLLESRLTPEQETYVRGVRSSGEVLLRLVNDILDFSRFESGGLDLHAEPADVGAMVQDIGEMLAPRAHTKSIDLATDIGRGLPDLVMVDATRLRQVIANLADNAVKFTETGGLTLKVENLPGAAEGMARLAFSVADSGPGIAPADTQRIFGEFVQVDGGPGRRYGGAGLGLAISRRLVRRMGSDIVVRARPGGGSVFSLVLDLPVVAAASQPSEAALVGRRVLLLAPEGCESAVLADYLAEAGAVSRVLADIDEAVSLYADNMDQESRFDTVLIDHRIQPDPVAALERIRIAGNRPPSAVVLIEPLERKSLQTLRAAGFDAYLIRPVRRNSLTGIVADMAAVPGSVFRSDPEDQTLRARELPAVAHGVPVLLAEDNEVNALLVRATLEGLGYRVTEVRDGKSAVDAVTKGEQNYPVILLDLHMPGVDGIAAAAAVREHERRTGCRRAAIFALTADVMDDTRRRAAEVGIDAVLDKPISPDSLRRILADATDQSAGSASTD